MEVLSEEEFTKKMHKMKTKVLHILSENKTAEFEDFIYNLGCITGSLIHTLGFISDYPEISDDKKIVTARIVEELLNTTRDVLREAERNNNRNL